MKLIYCTLFDVNYLSRGLAMYDSLVKSCPAFHLYIFAFDVQSQEILIKLQLPHTTIISLNEFEDEALLAVKAKRSKAEYCWTCTPSTISYVLKKYKEPHCTYIDADMIFYSNPQPIYDEMGESSVLITLHNHTYDNEEKNAKFGKYCVQYMTFKNNEQGMEVLEWWRNACIEWCYDKIEDGKYGDQKYLDDWTERFPGVHVLKHKGGGLATWNIEQFKVEIEGGRYFAIEKATEKKFQFIFYHFHGVKFFADRIVWYTPDFISPIVVKEIYHKYVGLILDAENRVKMIYDSYNPDIILKTSTQRPLSLRDKIYLYRTGILNNLKGLKLFEAIHEAKKLHRKFQTHHYYYY